MFKMSDLTLKPHHWAARQLSLENATHVRTTT